MLKVTKQNHLICFDANSQYICGYTFGIALPENKKKDKDKDRENRKKEQQNQDELNIEIKQEYTINFYIDSNDFDWDLISKKKSKRFEYEWKSEYFDLEVKGFEEEQQFGPMPFSLETYLDIYRDPKKWQLSLRPKNDQIQLKTVLNQDIGKLVIKTVFEENPFLLPIHIMDHDLQAEKTLKVVVNAGDFNQEEGLDDNEEIVLSSAQFVGKQRADEVDVYVAAENEDITNGFYIYTFKANSRISSQHICIIKGKFQYKQLNYKSKKIHIYSGDQKPVEFIHNLEKIIKILKFIDHDIYIFQNVNTKIEDSYRMVFFTDLSSLYSRIFKSYLYSRIYDQWIIEGMVQYRRDNRHFQDCMTDLTEQLTEGEQFFPLSNSDYSFDMVWKTKAKFIYHILENLSNNNLTKQILEYTKKKKMTSPMILKKMKDKFGVDRIKTIYEQQFINSTGMNRIFYEMDHLKRQHKIKITLRQKSLMCGIFRKYNRYRIKLEEMFGLVSPIMERIIRKNEKKKSEMSGPLAVPKFLKCIPYFIGAVSVQIENSEPFSEQLQEQNITEKITDEKASLRIKRTTNKKNQAENSDSISWMMLDSSSVYPAVYKGKNLSESVIESLVKRIYESQIEQLKVLNSISIKQHSEKPSICKLLIQKVKIKPGKEDCKISVKRKILQILPNFLSKCPDPVIYDQILELLHLYEPICYDYSQQGNLFLHSLIECIGYIQYSVKMSQYFQQFHRIFLMISKYHHSIFNEDKFEHLHKQIFKSMTKWLSKYSYKILEQARDYLQITSAKPRRYLSLIKIIIENVLEYIDMMNISDQNKKTGICKQIHDLINMHVKRDTTGLIRAVIFWSVTSKRQKSQTPLRFLELTFSELEEIKDNQFEAYALCLQRFKDVLNKNRQRYAYEIQAEILNQNQNYFLAEYLWKQMCSRQSRYNAQIRLGWMKIYRIFYFYYTPIITMVKLSNNIITKEFPLDQNQTAEVLDNIMDFVPDLKWFSVYDSSNNKKKKINTFQGRKKKKQYQEYVFTDKNMFTVYVMENPSKANWEDLSKLGLDYLKKEYENKEIQSGKEKYKSIVDRIKQTSQKLKRGNMPNDFTYDKMRRKIYSALKQYDEDLEMAKQLFTVLQKTLEEVESNRKRKQSEQKGDTNVYLPLLNLNLGTKSVPEGE